MIAPQKKKSTKLGLQTIIHSEESQKIKFEKAYMDFLKELVITEPYVYEHIKSKIPLYVRLVKVQFYIKVRYELVFQNSYYIKIPKRIYDLYPDKRFHKATI